MRLVRYQHNHNTHFGHLDGDWIGALAGDIFGEFVRGPRVAPLADVTLLAPSQPSKIIAISFNFADRVREIGVPTPELPVMFFKAPSALIGPHEAILLPPQSQNVQYAAELAVVIGRRAHRVTPESATAHILGYACANDVVALDLALQDGTWTRASNFDTFGPLGPWIATGLDPADLRITCTVNGQTRQMSSTRDMLFGVPQVVAFVSSVMTLLPGDVILMGSPAGAGPLADGDVVEVEIEGIGVLRNPVRAEARD